MLVLAFDIEERKKGVSGMSGSIRDLVSFDSVIVKGTEQWKFVLMKNAPCFDP